MERHMMVFYLIKKDICKIDLKLFHLFFVSHFFYCFTEYKAFLFSFFEGGGVCSSFEDIVIPQMSRQTAAKTLVNQHLEAKMDNN